MRTGRGRTCRPRSAGGYESTTRGEVWTLPLEGDPIWSLALPAGGGPEARFSATAIYDPDGDRMVIYGGVSTLGSLPAGVRALSLASMTWSQIEPGNGPAPTGSPGSTAIYDPVGKRMIEYDRVDGHVWSLSLGATPAWTDLLPAPGPVPRAFHSVLYDTLRHRMVIYGGYTGSDPPLGDVWALSLDGAPTWSSIAVVGTVVNSYRHTAIYDPVGDRMIAFGGTLGQAWSLPFGTTSSWSLLPVGITAPAARVSHNALYDPAHARMLVYGGDGFIDFSDTWALDLVVPEWTRITPPTTTPFWRTRHAAIVDPLRDRMILFGGLTQGFAEPSGLWTLSLGAPETWSVLAPSGTPPSNRQGASAIYDPRRDRMIVFGGQTGATTEKSAELWSLSLGGGPAWSPLAASGPPPPARAFHSAIYDPFGDRMIVFGGEDALAQPLADLWQLTLDGTPEWTPLTPTGGLPAPRSGHIAFFDPPRERMVVVGGRDMNGVAYSDAWELPLRGPAAWIALAPTGSAPARAFQPGIYDPPRDRFVLAGGSFQRLDAFRSLSLGASPAWAPLAPSGVLPDARDGETAVYDAIRDRVLVFGGGQQRANSLWELSFGSAPATAPAVACPGDISWIAGSPSGVSYDVTNPFAFADTVDYQVTSERDWPGYPIRGSAPVADLDHAAIAFGAPVPDTAAIGLNTLTFRATLRRTGWSVECTHHLHDVTTPTLLALVSTDAQPDRVTLRWFGEGAVGRATVERRAVATPWQTLGEATADGRGGYAYEDRGVVAGAGYGYRLKIADASGTTWTTESWVEIPVAWSLALEGARPNPARTPTIAFTLPGGSLATLELWDVAGRRIESRRVDGLGPGSHQVRLAEGRRLAPGLYLVRLTQRDRALSARVVICY